MDTEFTLRAAQLKDLYETITMKGLDKDERLDALLTLKATVRVSYRNEQDIMYFSSDIQCTNIRIYSIIGA